MGFKALVRKALNYLAQPMHSTLPQEKASTHTARNTIIHRGRPAPTLTVPPLMPRELEDRPLPFLRSDIRRDGDGIWHCYKCRNEVLLKTQDGVHPFGHLQCACNHVICDECTTTSILAPFTCKDADPVIVEQSDVQYVQICQGCGLTWLGRKDSKLAKICHHLKHLAGRPGMVLRFAGVCDCGEYLTNRCFRFRVGSNTEFKEGDPDICYAMALERRLQRAVTASSSSQPVVWRPPVWFPNRDVEEVALEHHTDAVNTHEDYFRGRRSRNAPKLPIRHLVDYTMLAPGHPPQPQLITYRGVHTLKGVCVTAQSHLPYRQMLRYE